MEVLPPKSRIIGEGVTALTSAYGANENDSSPRGRATAKMRCVRLQKPSDFRNT